MKVYLKVKVTSLAEEARIIRRIARKVRAAHDRKRHPGDVPPQAWFGLNAHRTFDVRREARSSHLAYGFLRGVPYRAMEEKAHEAPNWKRVEQLVTKYGEGDPRERMQRFSEWKEEPAA
jgi:hypothetical protein